MTIRLLLILVLYHNVSWRLISASCNNFKIRSFAQKNQYYKQ